ncbi:MAG TPA: hypothetical protein VGB44_07440 [Flavobacterium sp.]|jgi:hypothetical protein
MRKNIASASTKNSGAPGLTGLRKLTTGFGLSNVVKISELKPESDYTLEHNARALIVVCEHYDTTNDQNDLKLIRKYLQFIAYCQQADGTFLNYVDSKHNFSIQNTECNLEVSNATAVWALGTLISFGSVLPQDLLENAEMIIERAMPNIEHVHCPRAMALTIRGLYRYNKVHDSKAVRLLIKRIADRLTQMYLRESSIDWQWFENNIAYCDTILPEALLLAYHETHETTYEEAAKKSGSFLISQIFTENGSMAGRSMSQEQTESIMQPRHIADTILSLNTFYEVYKDVAYLNYMKLTQNLFLDHSSPNSEPEKDVEMEVSYLLAKLCINKAEAMHESRRSKIAKLKRENYAFKT